LISRLLHNFLASLSLDSNISYRKKNGTVGT
jgi:hypothetical protein